MVASTDIKFYVHNNNNAPQLQNAYGSMINVLDACLVNGINIGTISSLTASGKTVTALFSSAHNLMQYQVIKIVGANQPEYNVEARILTVPNATTLTFELAVVPSVTTATGTIGCSLSPLGWEKPFSSSSPSGGGKVAYRSTNLLLSSRPFLRVVDEPDLAYNSSFAKFAKVGIVENMTDIDTMLGVQAPFDSAVPDKNWVGTGSGDGAVNGWARWYYASNTESTNASYNVDYQAPNNANRQWVLIGTKDYFYIIPEIKEGYSSGLLYGFGYFESLIPVDSANTFLSATLSANNAGDGKYKRQLTALTSTYANSCVILRNYLNSTTYTTASAKSFLDEMNSGQSNRLVNNINSGTTAFDVFLVENGGVVRGRIPLLKWLYSQLPYSNLNLVTFGHEIFLAKNVAGGDSGASTAQVLLKVGALL